MKKTDLLALVEGAAMIALATVLSMIPVMNMPFGGSITACSMLPITLISYRRGTKWGLLTATVYAVLQMFLGFNNLRYGTSFAAVCAIIFLDYIFAFAALGLAGIFKNKFRSQSGELLTGILIACVIRLTCHFIAGCTVWADVSIPKADAVVFSLAYNSAYMIPETILTLAGAWYLSQLLDFRGEKITGNKEKMSKSVMITEGIGTLALIVGIVFDALYVFMKLQTEDGFDWNALSDINVGLIAIVTVVSALIWGAALCFGKFLKKKMN